jgi:hypothetical protein
VDVLTLTATSADPFFELIRTGIGGAVIGVVLGRLATEDPASSA